MTHFLRNKTTLDYMLETCFSLNALIYPNLLTKYSPVSQTTESGIVLSLNLHFYELQLRVLSFWL